MAQAGAPDVRFNDLVDMMPTHGASDLHMKVGAPVIYRIGGILRGLDMPGLSPEQMDVVIKGILSAEQLASLKNAGSVDLSHSTQKGCRVRVNIFYQRGVPSIAARFVNQKIPTFDELSLPIETMKKIANSPSGLVIVVGSTGSGKSTTIASVINYINATRKCHILTLEDPIEYVYKDDKAIVNQREIGIDSVDFKSALKFALREDPDVILLGEMRDEETISVGLTAAETGHLVFGTVHAATCPQSISRLLGMFESEKQEQMRRSISMNLRAVVAQKLLKRATGKGRVPALEIMIANSTVRKMIDDGESDKLGDLIVKSREEGMIDFTHCLHQLVLNKSVTAQEALANAPNRNALQSLFDGLHIR